MRLIDVPAETRITFVCEKPSQARHYAAAWHYARPDTVPPLFIALTSLVGAQTVMPRHIPYDGLPRFMNPTWKPLDREPSVFSWEASSPEDISNIENLTEWGQIQAFTQGHLKREPCSIDDALAHADVIACGCDPDIRGAGMFSRFVETRMGLTHNDRAFPVIYTIAEDPESLKAGFASGLTTRSPEFLAVFNQAECRQVFHFNWSLNSLPIFGDVLRHVGITENAFISKFQVLLLHALAERGPMSEGEIVLMMRDWKGSGKWEKRGEDVFGSPASRDAIMRQILEKGLLSALPINKEGVRSRIAVSEIGRAFLSHLHPDSYDPDLGFRLVEWGKTWPASRPAMERYIRTYFGKQKRFFAKNLRRK